MHAIWALHRSVASNWSVTRSTSLLLRPTENDAFIECDGMLRLGLGSASDLGQGSGHFWSLLAISGHFWSLLVKSWKASTG
jgi:hypothetical protein